MKITRQLLATVNVGEYIVEIHEVEYRQKADAPLLATELTASMAGSPYVYIPDLGVYRDAGGNELGIDFVQLRGYGKSQRCATEGVGRAWSIAKGLMPADVPVTLTQQLDGSRTYATMSDVPLLVPVDVLVDPDSPAAVAALGK